jgi:hypothetical protein
MSSGDIETMVMPGEARRAFTQLVAAAGTLPLHTAEQHLRALEQHTPIHNAIAAANLKLAQLHLEITLVISEVDALKYVTMINTRADDTAKKFAYLNSEAEVKYAKLLAKKLIDSNGEIGRLDAIGLRSSVPKMTDSLVRGLLDTMVRQGLLQEGEQGETLYIGPKMQAELRPVLMEMAEALSSCKVCGELCIRSIGCRDCREFRVHRHCGEVVRACSECGKELAD